MPRATNNPASKARRKRVFEAAKGFRGGRRNLLRQTLQAVDRALANSTAHRKVRKGEFRRLWIARINAAVRLHDADMNYSRFIHLLAAKGMDLDRRQLADMAVREPEAFGQLVRSLR
ncbi:MAG: 50S ribosomal protein L20 [bacterium]|nr:50S ribosomal protein L20 [bacterium]